MKKLLLMFAILITLQHASFSQTKTIASLKATLQSGKDDTTRLGIYLDLADSASLQDKLSYGERAVKLADKLLAQGPDKKVRKRLLEQKARAYNFVAHFYSLGRQADARKVIDYANRMLQIHTEIGDKKGIMQVYFGLAGTYLNANDSARFLQYAQKAVALSLETKDTLSIVEGYSWISQYYLSLGDFPEALEAIQKALAISRRMNYQKGVAGTLLRMADLYRDNGENKQALQNYHEASSILYQQCLQYRPIYRKQIF